MKYYSVLLFVISCFFVPLQATAQTTPYTIERSEVSRFKSESLGRSYDVYVKLPRSYSKQPDTHYPIILLTDGGYAFPLVSSITRQMSGAGKITEPIVVGLSYAKEESWQKSRTRDYTPTHSPNESNYHSKEARKVSGGAEEYTVFLKTELMPFLSEKYRVDSKRKIFAGHSFGGLLGGYILKTHPDAFDFYIISDPSFWYHEGSIFEIKSTDPSLASKNSDDLPDVLIVSQKHAGPTDTKNENGNNMERGATRFHQQLLANPSFYESVKLEVIDNEIHETLFPISVSHGMRQFLGK